MHCKQTLTTNKTKKKMKKLFLLTILCALCTACSDNHIHQLVTINEYLANSEFTCTYDYDKGTLLIPSYKVDSCTICHQVITTSSTLDLNYCPSSSYKIHRFTYKSGDIYRGVVNYRIEECKWCGLLRFWLKEHPNRFSYQNPLQIQKGCCLNIVIEDEEMFKHLYNL